MINKINKKKIKKKIRKKIKKNRKNQDLVLVKYSHKRT
tara:strand:+ start:1382 stop:1495 length:114 start_codon:yes stop_codon:yes gene_type:complete